jgi:hypothetical protein
MATQLFRGGVFVTALLCCAFAAAQDDNFIGVLPATTVQLPTFGIAIDAEGTLDARTFKDFDGKLLRERLAAAKAAKPGELWALAILRKVSLIRLEAALAAEIAAGRGPDDVMRNLAGLTRVQYVFCLPAADGKPGDIILAGPAEPFALDPAGRAVGLASGKPVLQLEDLAAALRAYPPGSDIAGKRDRPFLGCTISPRADGLAKLVQFQKTVPRSVRVEERGSVADAMAKGVADSLGLANIEVYGVSPRTHFAQVLVEADYRMKRIAIGVEPPPIKMTTFVGALTAPQQGMLQRWWFTPEYKCVRLAEDKLAAELVGQGVQLQAEDKLIGADGSLAAAGAKPNKASELYTLSFTQKYSEISAASPVYAQLRNMIDLAITAAIIRRHDYYSQAECNAELLRDEARYPIETFAAPKQANCVVNSLWKGARLFTPAGGGVSIRPDEALAAENLLPDDQQAVAAARGKVEIPAAAERWWWD